VVRIAGAFLSNMRTGRTAQGGSTLTQQLARQSFLNTDKTYSRKMKEVIVAARIEKEFEKRDILQLYLNKVYFGDGLYGAEAASLGYFGKPAADLTLPKPRFSPGSSSRPRRTPRRSISIGRWRAQGRAPGDAGRRRDRSQRLRCGRQRRRFSSTTRSAVRNRSASTSRKKFASSSSSGSAGSACTKAG
jgi:penicillin-binding protein 1A